MAITPAIARRCSATGITIFLLLLFLLPHSVLSFQPPHLQKKTFTFHSFNKGNNSFRNFGDAMVDNNALQLTPDTVNNPDDFLRHKSGRVIFPNRFKLWENGKKDSGTNVASFNTTFDINMFWVNGTSDVGEGMAFVIFPDTVGPPLGSSGGYLGLTNSTTDGNSTNKFVAVELDTHKQDDYDPDNNHVGLNINSVKSNVTASLWNSSAGYNIRLSPKGKGANYTVWVDYNGTRGQIKVYMANQSLPKPPNPVLTAGLNLSHHISQYSYFGFAGSTGESYELNCILRWNITVDMLTEEPGPNVLGWLLKVGLPLLVVALTVLVVVLNIFVRQYKKKGKHNSRLRFALTSLPGMPKEYDYKALKFATGNFDTQNRLGKGGFGDVYKGKLPGNGTEVAVKSFSRESNEGDDFLAELAIINRLRHRNLVPLLGWCYKNGKLLLVYEYMPNGSLDKHIYIDAGQAPLPWNQRYQVISGTAQALQYLHNEYDQMVVHRDLKASNIMLDSSFNARLGDFGLARTIENGRTSYVELGNGMPGTPGYIAYECLHTFKATRESDVYGFGAVVLEVVCGRRPGAQVCGFELLVNWVWTLHREGRILDAVDEKLASDYVAEEAKTLLLLGLACCHPMALERPKTHDIVQIIGKSLPAPTVPPFKPAFVWPGCSLDDLDLRDKTTSGSVAYTIELDTLPPDEQ